MEDDLVQDMICNRCGAPDGTHSIPFLIRSENSYDEMTLVNLCQECLLLYRHHSPKLI